MARRQRLQVNLVLVITKSEDGRAIVPLDCGRHGMGLNAPVVLVFF